jgi:hypothetical protein
MGELAKLIQNWRVLVWPKAATAGGAVSGLHGLLRRLLAFSAYPYARRRAIEGPEKIVLTPKEP